MFRSHAPGESECHAYGTEFHAEGLRQPPILAPPLLRSAFSRRRSGAPRLRFQGYHTPCGHPTRAPRSGFFAHRDSLSASRLTGPG
eukprot:2640609-Rhodomonas_salina.1